MSVFKLAIILLSLIVVVFFWLVTKHYRKVKRRSLFLQPIPKEWDNILKTNVPIYNRLPRELKGELKGHLQVFLAEKNFEGARGLEISEQIRVTIAAQACVLLLNRKNRYFSKLMSIIVYPEAYVARRSKPFGNVQMVGYETCLGEAWNVAAGALVLSWADVLRDTRNDKDGHNVVFHEFAHQLDFEDGAANGLPPVKVKNRRNWARVLGTAFADHQRRVNQNIETVIDAYGATNPAEFFAVLTETFFEIPGALLAEHPDIYQELKNFYQVDPVEW